MVRIARMPRRFWRARPWRSHRLGAQTRVEGARARRRSDGSVEHPTVCLRVPFLPSGRDAARAGARCRRVDHHVRWPCSKSSPGRPGRAISPVGARDGVGGAGPLLTVGALWAVLSQVFETPSFGVPYIVYLLSGMCACFNRRQKSWSRSAPARRVRAPRTRSCVCRHASPALAGTASIVFYSSVLLAGLFTVQLITGVGVPVSALLTIPVLGLLLLRPSVSGCSWPRCRPCQRRVERAHLGRDQCRRLCHTDVLSDRRRPAALPTPRGAQSR